MYEPSVNVQTDAENESQSYITVAEAKAAVLENVGLLEENVRFVRINLDAGSGIAKYDIEFISENAEYDYSVNASTGEILSMLCENGSYDIEKLPLEADQTAQDQQTAQGQQTEQGQPEAGQPAQNQQAAQSQPEAGQPAQNQQAAQSQPEAGQTAQNQQPAQSQPEAGQPAQNQQAAQSQPEAGQTAQNQQAAQSQPEAGQTAQNQQTAQGQSQAGQQFIGVEAAKNIALEHAGLQSGAVRFVHAHLEYDDRRWQYDVEFHKDSMEYDYDIDALSGEIISYDYDAEYYQHGIDNSSGSGQITADKAKSIALEYAGIAETQAQYLTVEFDYDDGRAEYQVEWYVGRMEYSCDIDAATGAILSFEKEYD